MSNSIIKQIYDYPELIAQLEREYYQDFKIKRKIEEKINLFNAELELEIANDSSLRNEGMRKAQKTISQQTNKQYQDLLAQLEKAEHREKVSLITLERYKREFSVLKLEAKNAIAKLEEVAA